MTAAQLAAALEDVACLFGDPMFADDLGRRFSCREADVIARVLLTDDRRSAAATWLEAHAGWDDPTDDHNWLPDIDVTVQAFISRYLDGLASE